MEEILKNNRKKLEEKERLLNQFEKYEGIDRIVPSDEIVKQLKENANKKVFNVKTNIPKLNSIVEDFREGQLIVISAPTGQGKTTLMQTFTDTFEKQEARCLWFSYEMGHREFFEKFADRVPLFYLPQENKQGSMTWLEAKIIEGIAKYQTKIVFIDHLHFLMSMEDMAKARSQSILMGMIMRKLKQIAIEHDLIIFLAAHVKKSLSEKEPTIEDLRDSSFIGQESDIVLMLWRLEQNNSDILDNKAKLKVVKNRRTGNLGLVKLYWSKHKFLEETDNYE